MEKIDYFVPGNQVVEQGILVRLRRPIPPGVTHVYTKIYTKPGEVVLAPYCQGPAVVREALDAGCRTLALNYDPVLIMVVEAALAPLPVRELDTAVARLGDSLKQGVPLRRYLTELYATTCPACLRPAVADYFVWDRERGAPVAKYLRCPACAWDGRTAVDPEDRERLDEVPVQGMHYHYVLDRVMPQRQGNAFHTRLQTLLTLYSARNLYALAELTLKIESLFPEGPTRQVLKVLLLDCLDRCCSLSPLPGSTARQRGLRRPGRFLERNVWHAFEQAATRLQDWTEKPVPGLVDSLESFPMSGEEGAGFVGQGLVRDLLRSLSPRSIRLILVSPPLLDSAVWSLSYLWGAWLLGTEAVAPLRPLLRQRTPDPTWYARVMAGSFRNLASLLGDRGRLVLIMTGQRPAMIEALLLAASEARLGVVTLVQCGADYRLELTPTFPQPVASTPTALEVQIQEMVVEAARGAIQVRGEPVAWRSLHTAVLRRLAETGLLVRMLENKDAMPSPFDAIAEQVKLALEVPVFLPLLGGEGEEMMWWLAHPTDVAAPLCDRVEAEAYQVLQDTLALTESDFARAVYACFPDALTPGAELVAACLRAYGHELTPDYWQLRREDLPAARQAERQDMIDLLLALGQRLGYQTAHWEPFDVAWLQGGQVRAAFVVHWRAAVSDALALSDRAAGIQPYLVIPGGRAALVSHKLAHNPLWQQVVDEAGWRFIKYRHVRQLASQSEVDEYVLRTVVGLDPIVEREQAQLPLF